MNIGLSLRCLYASVVVCLLSGSFGGRLQSQEAPRTKPSWDLSHGDLKVSANRRFLVHEDGTPFFYLSDTNWELFHRARREDARRLIENRRQKGFTVICGPVTGILDVLKFKKPLAVPNPYGDIPFLDGDVTRLDMTPGADPSDSAQYDYWDHVDYIVDLAESNGIFVALLFAWHNHYSSGLINKNNARTYARHVATRYGSRSNIIWVLGGDSDASKLKEVYREMAAGVREGDGGRHLITFHPNWYSSSSKWFHTETWLDFNMLQSSHGSRDKDNYEMIRRDYERLPVKPTMDGENRYEDHSVNWKPKNGWFNDYDNRQAAYWGLFAGGHGHTYGCRGVWQMYEPGRDKHGALNHYWYDAMDLPGALDMKHVRDLMVSRPMLSRVPDQSLVEDTYSGADHIQATRGDGYAFIYAATGREFTVNLGRISGEEVVAWWFDPREGVAFRIGEFPNRGKRSYDPPGIPKRGNDWVLVLDDSSKKYPPPGATPNQ